MKQALKCDKCGCKHFKEGDDTHYICFECGKLKLKEGEEKMSHRLCCIKGCSKLSQGAKYSDMCKAHFAEYNQKEKEMALPPPEVATTITKTSIDPFIIETVTEIMAMKTKHIMEKLQGMTRIQAVQELAQLAMVG